MRWNNFCTYLLKFYFTLIYTDMKKAIYLTFIQLIILTLTTISKPSSAKIADIFGEDTKILYIEDTWVSPL